MDTKQIHKHPNAASAFEHALSAHRSGLTARLGREAGQWCVTILGR